MVLLTGVMAGSAFPLWLFRSAALDEEGRRMLSVIEMTRREAIANGFPTQLWLDAEKGLYGMRELQAFRPMSYLGWMRRSRLASASIGCLLNC